MFVYPSGLPCCNDFDGQIKMGHCDRGFFYLHRFNAFFMASVIKSLALVRCFSAASLTCSFNSVDMRILICVSFLIMPLTFSFHCGIM